MHSKIEYVVKAFKAGATGYMVKESAAERLVDALESVVRGEYYLDHSLSHQVVEELTRSPEKDMKIADGAYGSLTPREQEILRVLAEGLSVKEIADKLFISPKTVENHRSNIMKKLGLDRRGRMERLGSYQGPLLSLRGVEGFLLHEYCECDFSLSCLEGQSYERMDLEVLFGHTVDDGWAGPPFRV
jgi:DNA-binding CsgD family transcriptional regulator